MNECKRVAERVPHRVFQPETGSTGDESSPIGACLEEEINGNDLSLSFN
jgi:hypothetical protein